MRRFLAIFVCGFLLTSPTRGDEPKAPDGTPWRVYGGLIVVRQGDQRIRMLGGALLPRSVKVTEATPEGPVVYQFTAPSAWQGSPPLPVPGCAPARLQVQMPDDNGLLYIEDELIRSAGTSRQVQSPPLAPGRSFPLRVRAAFKSGENLLIEDKQVMIRAGQVSAVAFDGSRALSVPLPRTDADLPAPRRAKD